MRLAAALLVAAMLFRAAAADEAQNDRSPGPHPALPAAQSADESLRAIHVRPGFTVELVAAEPLVVDPVAFDWGPDGRLWVAEMRDYPSGLDGEGKPGGTIRCLEDVDGDGRYDRATVFLDEVPFPSGVKVWRQGIIVTAAPDIIYAEDTDGDGRADRREILFHGFGEGNQQHRVNGLTFGLDNWLYCGNGDSGGTIESTKTGEKVPIGFRDFRIRPDDGSLDLVLGQSQFTRVRDDWGNWFGSSNSDPLYQFLLDDRYAKRNRHVALPNLRVDVSETPGAAPVYPLSTPLPRFNDFNAVNRFTSACGATIYRDELFGPQFAGNAYVSEPVHNLVHREVMSRAGVRFVSRRAEDEQRSEFLASSDNWFRPTTLRTGPDGALWIADMYRAVIEHPDYIPAEWQKHLDLRAGDTMGRIYRVYPTDAPPRAIPRLDRLDTAGLVAAIDSPNGPQRDMAQQLLVWRNDGAAVPLLNEVVASSARPLARLHALCTLDGLEAIDEAALLAGLRDPSGGVRRHALRLAEPWLPRSAAVAAAALRLANDDDPQVRLQLGCTLGAWGDPRSGETLGRMAIADADDPYIAAAIISSVGPAQLDGVTSAVLSAAAAGHPPAELLQNVMAVAASTDDSRPLVRLLGLLAAPHDGAFARWQIAALAGLLDMLDGRNSSLATFRGKADDATKAAIDRLQPLFTQARATLRNEQGEPADRLAALGLVGRGLDLQQSDLDLIAGLLTARTSPEIQSAAVAALARIDDPRVPTLLLARWKGYGSALRGEVLDALLRRQASTAALLDALEHGDVAAAEIDASRRQRLMESPYEVLRARAAKLFADSVASNRQSVIDEYRQALAAPGDALRGKEVFRKHCAACHRLEGVGAAVGPDLAALTDASPEALLVAVFAPNRAVESKFISYSALTSAGQTYTGMLAAETGASVTLIGQDGKEITILRTDLESLSSTSRSLMPEGLEKDVSQRDFADVVAYLSAARSPRRLFAGNQPKVIAPEALRGELWLLASDAAIYGETLVYDGQGRDLARWQSSTDHAVWDFDVTAAGQYIVRIDYACDDAAAGNAYQLAIGNATIGGKVKGTGNHETYRQLAIGRMTLQPGRYRAVLRPDGKLSGDLMNLKSVRITPVDAL